MPTSPTSPLSDPSLDRYARMTRRALGARVALVTVGGTDGRAVEGFDGAAADLELVRGLTQPRRLGQLVVDEAMPMVASDVRDLARLADSLPAEDCGVVLAYAGWPLRDHTGRPVGSLCAVDLERHEWSELDVEALHDLADACSAEIAQRELQRRAAADTQLAEHLTERGRVLLALSEGLSSTRTLADVAAAVEQVSVEELGCKRAGIWLDLDLVSGRRRLADVRSGDVEQLVFVPNDKAEWQPAMKYAAVPVDADNPIVDAMLRQRPVYLRTVQDQSSRFPEAPGQPEAGEARTFQPLLAPGNRLGTLVMTWEESRDFWAEDRATLSAMASYTAQALERALLLEERVAASRTLQSAMLTTRLPESGDLDLAARYLPASTREQVGGDWYDSLQLPSGCTAVVIGDVVGHDIAAAADMSQLRNILRGLAWASDAAPSQIVSSLDRALPRLGVEVLSSLVFARIERTEEQRRRGRHSVRWTNAGHLPLLLVGEDGTSAWLGGDESHDPLLGVDPSRERADLGASVEDGSTLLLFTDGLMERRGEDLDVGLHRLRDSAVRHRERPVDQMLDAILGDLLEDHLSDDVAVLAVRFRRDAGRQTT